MESAPISASRGRRALVMLAEALLMLVILALLAAAFLPAYIGGNPERAPGETPRRGQ